MSLQHDISPNIAVVGGGASGLIAALAFASTGLPVTLVAPPRPADARASALMDGSVQALKALGLWDELRPHASPLRTLRLIDGTKRLLRAPQVDFRADELDLEAFAWNIENEALLSTLEAAVSGHSRITRLMTRVLGFDDGPGGLRLRLEDGTDIHAALVAAADGRESPSRKAAGIEVRSRSYPQVAVTATLEHDRPHGDISTEFHTETGPFTLVPLPGNRSNIVCVVSQDEADRLGAMDDASFGREMERRSHSVLGAMRLASPRGRFPLSVRTAERFATKRIALIGEAAHIIPPIGAQGLNLGIRDLATLAELAANASRKGMDIGGRALLDEYERRRRADVESRSLAVHLLNRSLLSDLLPVAGLRGMGMWVLDRSPLLRRKIMREGVGPSRDVPRLIRGEQI